MSIHNVWLKTVKNVIDQHQGEGCFQILFSEYRPDLTHAMAHSFDLQFYDYRAEKMNAAGWDAGKISLDELTSALHNISIKSGLVAHNVEALLSTKSEFERKNWLAEFFSMDWPNMIILPISLYQTETLTTHSRICDLQHIALPKESFLMRLAT